MATVGRNLASSGYAPPQASPERFSCLAGLDGIAPDADPWRQEQVVRIFELAGELLHVRPEPSIIVQQHETTEKNCLCQSRS